MKRSEILKNAWNFVKNEGMSFRNAINRAWALVKKETEYLVSFVKEDGTITERVAKNITTNSKGNLMFWSLNDDGLRSAKPERVLEIKRKK